MNESGHSISIASHLTGIPIETLRVWERRYGFPSPNRRDGSNRRFYSDEEIERLRWIARAIQRGFRAGDIVPKSISELEALLGARPEAGPTIGERPLTNVSGLIDLLQRDEVAAIEDELRRMAAILGPKRFVTELVQPLTVAVGHAWETRRIEVRHEHFMSEALTTRLRHMLSEYQDVEGSPLVLLATLSDEQHTLGLAMAALYLAMSGAKPRLLGGPTPREQLVAAAKAVGADVVGITVTASTNRDATRREVQRLARDLPRRMRLWLGGSGAPALGVKAEGVRIVPTWKDVDEALAEYRERP